MSSSDDIGPYRIERVTRRRVLLGLGAALALSASRVRADKSVAIPEIEREVYAPLAFVGIGANGTVTIVAHRVEMGQGIRATLAAVIADEIGLDWSRVSVRQAPADEETYGNQNTDGSRSIRHFLQPMREIGAAIRTMLESAAARLWSVNESEIEIVDHIARHRPTGRRLDVGPLAEQARDIPVPPRDRLRLRTLASYPHVGSTIPDPDLPALVDGTMRFSIDQQLAGMLVAVIARPPSYLDRVARFDASDARLIPGVVRIVELPTPAQPGPFRPLGGVAVVARDTWTALKAREALKVEWTRGPNAGYDSAVAEQALRDHSRVPGRVVRKRGDAPDALASAECRVVADYFMPHLAHAPLEPPTATALYHRGLCTVWAGTQDPQATRREVAVTLGLDWSSVTVHVPRLGGGFGRKSTPDFAVEAALLARELPGSPVKVIWTRTDDLQNGYYHTICAAHLEGAVDGDGRLMAWLHRSTFPSILSLFDPTVRDGAPAELGMGLIDVPWTCPHLQIENGSATAHVRTSWFRSVANLQHVLPVQCFMDEIAHAAKRDPLDFLIESIGPARMFDPGVEGTPYVNYREPLAVHPIDTGRLTRVLRTVAAEAHWGAPLPAGDGRGIACHRSFGSYAACVAHVRVERDGTLVIVAVDIGLDCGFVANPDRVRAQLEGCVAMGLSQLLYGQITFAGGRVQQSNFHDYPILRVSEAPRTLRTHLVRDREYVTPGGAGEPAMAIVAPAVLNAIYAASGRRIRRLPLGDQLVSS